MKHYWHFKLFSNTIVSFNLVVAQTEGAPLQEGRKRGVVDRAEQRQEAVLPGAQTGQGQAAWGAAASYEGVGSLDCLSGGLAVP